MKTGRVYQIAFSLALMLSATLAQAQASRTWVSGVGDDANPCSRTAPCKTLAGAIAKTASNGEIDVLDPAGVGAVTITKAITIDGGAGQVGSVLVSGTNGIVVSAGSGDDIILRNLSINGLGNGLNGVLFNNGHSLRLENVKIDRFVTSCLNLVPSTSNATIEIFDSVLSNCVSGVLLQGSSGATATLEHTQVVLNSSVGVSANGSGNLMRLSNSTILDNFLGVNPQNGASIVSFNNNRLRGNTTDGSVSATYLSR